MQTYHQAIMRSEVVSLLPLNTKIGNRASSSPEPAWHHQYRYLDTLLSNQFTADENKMS
jgi:hypothetical protein